MLFLRVELFCHAWPDGNIPHGHVDVKVKESGLNKENEEEMAKDAILSQISRECYSSEDGIGMVFAHPELLSRGNDDFDKGEVYAEVVSGEGDALDQNPVGKQFFEF